MAGVLTDHHSINISFNDSFLRGAGISFELLDHSALIAVALASLRETFPCLSFFLKKKKQKFKAA